MTSHVRQMVVWLEWKPNPDEFYVPGRFDALSMPMQPKRVWTLLCSGDRDKPPTLPITPQHNHNAFLEDKIHDWNWQNGKLYYYSRVAGGHVWLLLEF